MPATEQEEAAIWQEAIQYCVNFLMGAGLENAGHRLVGHVNYMNKCINEGLDPATGKRSPPPSTDDTLLEPKGEPRLDASSAHQFGFTGNMCPECGSYQMVRNGTCEKCSNCGATTGCS